MKSQSTNPRPDTSRRASPPPIKRRLPPWLAACLLALSLLPGLASAELKVVASLPTLGAVAKAVGGDHVKVSVLSSPNQDPHYVDARPSLVLPLNKADLLIQNGLELEESWLAPLRVQARNPAIMPGGAGFFDASTTISHLMQVPQMAIDRSMGDIHPGGNPHFLWDPRRIIEVTRGIGAKLTQLDPKNGPTYKANTLALIAKLEALTKAQSERFAALPSEARVVVAYHQSFPYLFHWLSLTQAETIEPRPGIPPSPDRIATVLATMRSGSARTVIQENYQPKTISETVAKLSSGKLVVLRGGVDFEKGETVETYLEEVADAIYAALAP